MDMVYFEEKKAALKGGRRRTPFFIQRCRVFHSVKLLIEKGF
jgi:hypothetical protein